MMMRAILLSVALLAAGPSRAAEAPAGCPALTLRLEEEIAKTPALREAANLQTVRDLRTLRDAAIVLDAYGYGPDCARLSAILGELLADPRRTIGRGGDTDEEKAEAVEEARTPKGARR
ncbi:PRC-barrel [Methylobacterium sp. 4-46]|uniref:hypothetical protein n=1 Tax=unclassified Methylobacterium TaxID=2615210 RepID=UPI000152BE9B|nr:MULTISPECIES: hypothetical protein [Methylobacterium]ACA15412.1 PRC-barrel [Methylobacterium sp. 4-46]WFT81131.1 photosystem reaction center subunit H [Methylobacterium nodulans]